MKPIVAALCAVLFMAGITELSASGREICKCKRITTPHLKSVHPKPKPRPATTPQATATFSGRATLLFLTNAHDLTQAPIIIGDTGLLGSAGGLRNVSVTSTSIVDVLQLSMGAATRSEATLQNFSTTLVTVGQGTHVLAFNLLQTVAEAECTTNGVVLTATSQIDGLTLDGVAVNVTGEINQVVQFPGGHPDYQRPN
ncbi:MAG: hypothetical protein L0Y58_16800 [Verrucomicrobia subdivision 3 bacterium]|nr:hypothetical protein [Limisphaerales bacterium]